METNEFNSKGNCRKWSIWKWIGYSLLGIIGIVAFSLLFGIVIMWLWNGLMPGIFHLPEITFWEAVGLAILARLLLGGCGHGHHPGWGHKRFHRRNWMHNPHCRPHLGHWNYYEDFWREEGENAFHEYVKRKEEGQTGK